MNNLHISLTDFRNESRVLKQATTISSLSKIEHVYIAALHEADLKKQEDIADKISLKRFTLKTRSLSRDLLAQILKYFEFVFRILFFYKKKNIGIVNIHALGLLPLGYLLKLIYGAKLIYDTHELETETNGSRGFRKKLGKWIERLFIKKADHVFVVSENIADWYRDNYSIPRPTVVLNAPREQQVEKNDYFRDTFGLRKDQIIVLYQGGLAVGRGVDLLLEAFKKRTDDKVVMVFMGYGNLEEEIQAASKSYSTIFFHKAVSPNVLLSYTVSADVGISFIENTCLSYYYCMPNKLFEYAMAGLPVIVSNMKEMREFVESHQMGVVVKEDTVESLNEAIEQLLNMDLPLLKNNAKKAALNNSWAHQEVKMRTVYQTLLESA
ncbi:MAG: glycosyltransferase family 4 protein [Hydrogenovibrio sp.]|uniref:glycosyltransferase family 4 protein n=1 Tax=Hydrogenovibrio sp. TaxID=2065821 RepID=UPI0028702C8D|nr:glycosyltransferase family 4 protein [Hydrogenovibrio sp.]MDR9498526.1 glycosyltransferase family 4 protein [Hydrogenovibrio sp.]MDR9499244.1 glycosyltransferase family 4 protein [Hydrogenovibrio sp.]